MIIVCFLYKNHFNFFIMTSIQVIKINEKDIGLYLQASIFIYLFFYNLNRMFYFDIFIHPP